MRRIACVLVLVFAAQSAALAQDSPLPPPRPGPRTPSPAAAPRSGMAMPTDYRLSAGDEIEVDVVLPKAIEAETTNPFREGRRFTVAPGGLLSVPKVKDVPLFGRTLGEVRADIEARLREGGVAANPDVFVSVSTYAQRFVYLVGAVYRKIEVTAFGRPNLLTVLAEAGEAMKDVDVASITVVSTRGPPRSVNFRSVLAAGGTSPEALLDAGDYLILVPAPPPDTAVPVVYIGGFVKSPGSYTLAEPGGSKRPITLSQLIIHVGGATERAALNRVTIRRARGEVVGVNFFAIMTNQSPDVTLAAGDMVYVND